MQRSIFTVLLIALPSLTLLAAEGGLEPIVIGNPQKIEVYPAQFKLDSPRREMHLIVTGHYADGTVQDLTRVAEFSSTNPQIAAIEKGRVVPAGDGQAEIVVRAGGQEVKAPVTVSHYASPDPVSFQYGTLVALSKHGCNSGACHGSPSGKGGFRLSLRAFDPKLDELTLVHEDFGRRTNPLKPEESLLLLKPLMKVPHGGGVKLRSSDPAFQIVREW